jgi:hypothetical protein
MNFFGFLGILRKMKQLDKEEVEMMFEYYLRSMAGIPEILEYSRKHGFENLLDLIQEHKPTNALSRP